MKQLLNSAVVPCEELCRSRRMNIIHLDIFLDLLNSLHPTQLHSLNNCQLSLKSPIKVTIIMYVTGQI